MARHTPGGNLRQKTKYVLSASTVALIVSLLGSPGIVDGQTLSDPVNETCYLHFGRGTVVGDKMFVDGGERTTRRNYLNWTDKPYPSSDMARWQTKFNTSKPPWTANPKPDDWNRYYNGALGALWNFGDGTFYTFGGWMSSAYEGRIPPAAPWADFPPPVIHAYDTKVATWTPISLPENVHRLCEIGYTQSTFNRLGYMLGGFPLAIRATIDRPIQLVADESAWQNILSVYDFKRNISYTSDLPIGIGATSNVILHSLDGVGNEGVLIALAGMSKNNNNSEDYRPMDEIWIYDVASSHWMKQVAIGDIPTGRARSCSVLVPAPDLSSYQLYMFSGIARLGVYVLDMYVLSIPAFVWKKIDLVNYPNEWGIVDMACGLYEDRQFIIVPGEVNVSTSATVNDTLFIKCNRATPVHVFDTYDWTFKVEFDPDNKGSKVSPAIVDLIGGDEKGNAKLQQPKAGWNTTELGQVFQIRNQLPARSTNSTNQTTPTPTDSSPYHTTHQDRQNVDGGDMSESKINSGAIAGGVVGGFVLLALLFWWRKRQGAEKTALPGLGASGHNGSLPQELQVHKPPQELQVCELPQELEAYEPPETDGPR